MDHHFVPGSSNHYVVLGLDASARPAQIKKAYKTAALKFHPDKNKAEEATAIFKRVSQAFQVLNDPDLKSVYDFDLSHGREPCEELICVHAPMATFHSVFGTTDLDQASKMESYSTSTTFQICGTSREDLNGQHCTFRKFDDDVGRIVVALRKGGQMISLKPEHLSEEVEASHGKPQPPASDEAASEPQHASKMESYSTSTTFQICGTSREELNGQHCTFHKFDDGSGRIVVELRQGGQMISLKPEHLSEKVEASHGKPQPPASDGAASKPRPSASHGTSYKPSPRKPASKLPLKFVIIGETGSGKTSFLNYLCNLPLMQAELRKSQNGDKGAFDKWEQRSFHVASSEQSSSATESQTKDANVYTVDGYDTSITAIDTPGLADTNGIAQDDEHLKKMQRAILKERFINCVVLVVNGRVPRVTAQISYVLNRLTSVLPSAIADKIVVVYTRVDIKEMLEFDPTTISEVIGRPIPVEQEFVFDNPFACVELLRKSAQRTGLPTSDKALRKLKHGFNDSMDDFQTLLDHMSTFPPIDVKFFKELFDAKASIEEEVVTLAQLLKENAEKQASVKRAVQDLSTAKEWKTKMADYEKHERTEQWIKVDNGDGTHNMVCNGCSATCHRKCAIPMVDAPSRFKACECFSSMTPKPLLIKTDDDLAEVSRKVVVSRGNVVTIETQEVVSSGVEWLEISDNCHLCGVDIIGDPAGDDYGAYQEWISDMTFSKKANTEKGYNMGSLKIGATIPMRDWSNLMRGEMAECRSCHCALKLHGHQTFTWKKEFGSRAVINTEMKQKYEMYQSEELQKKGILNDLQRQLQCLEDEATACKCNLQQAVDTFKEKSTATSYVRCLRSQIEYLDYQEEVTNGDANIRSDVRDARLGAIADQQNMLRANLSVLDEVERDDRQRRPASIRQPGAKTARVKTQQCVDCDGSGHTRFMGMGPKRACSTCSGSGQVAKTR